MKTIVRLAFVLIALGAATSCGTSPPPEGYFIRMRMTALDPTVIDRMTVSIRPQDPEQFMFVAPMSLEGGAISYEVTADGDVDLEISGAHVQRFTERQPDAAHIYELEVWSDDMEIHTPPLVVVNVYRGPNAIAMGQHFLPQWPLPLGGSVIVQVPCSAVGAGCFP